MVITLKIISGGVLCFGVEDEGGKLSPVGLESIDDITVIQEKLNVYLPPELKYIITPIIYSDNVEWDKLKNKKFLLFIIEFTPEYILFLPMKDDGGITRVDIFCRKNSSSRKCEYEDLRKILNNRIQTNVSTSLSTNDLNDLNILYQYKRFALLNPDMKKLYNLKLKIIREKIK